MQSELTSREFSEWIAFDRLEPIGPLRADFASAQICALVANALRGAGGKTYAPIDFMPFLDVDDRTDRIVTDPDEQWRLLTSIGRRRDG